MTCLAEDCGVGNSLCVVKLQEVSSEEQAAFAGYAANLRRVASAYLATPRSYGSVEVEGTSLGFTVRPYIVGSTLQLGPARLSCRETLRLLWQLALGLSAMHERNLVHLDLKPANVVMRRTSVAGFCQELDAVVIDASHRSHVDGVISAVTVGYAAPEVWEGSTTPASDLYSLGVIGYQALVGERPFHGQTLADVIGRQRAGDRSRLDGVQLLGLRELVESLLEPYANHRPDSTAEVIQRLAGMAEDVGVPPVLDTQARFVGRQQDFARAAALLLDGERHSRPVAVVGECGSGVTSLVQELQDRLEPRGCCVFSARPRAHTGRALMEQLDDQVRRVARRRNVEAHAAGAAVLDALAVAAEGRTVVVILDDVESCDDDEAAFVVRLCRQQALLSSYGVLLGGHSMEPVASLLSSNAIVRLEGLDRAPGMELARALLSEVIDKDVLERVAGVRGGLPGAIRRTSERLRAHMSHGRVEQATVDAAIRAASDIGLADVAVVARDPALAAFVLWGTPIRTHEWEALRALACLRGTPSGTESYLGRAEANGEEYISTHFALAEALVSECRLTDSQIAGVLDLLGSGLRGATLGSLAAGVRFLGRVGRVPDAFRWRALRSAILLLRAGEYCAVRAFARGVSGEDRTSWWSLLVRTCDAEEGRWQERDLQRRAEELTGTSDRIERWLVARALSRARRKEDAFRLLAADVAAFRHGPCWLRVLEDFAVLAAETGRMALAGRLAREMRGRARAGPRRVMSYSRARHRIEYERCRYGRAATWADVEGKQARLAGERPRLGAALNNQGASLFQAGRREAAASAFAGCVAVRECDEDERVLVVALNNLAIALSEGGHSERAVLLLNRAHAVAARNGVATARLRTMVNMGLVYWRSGRLRVARKKFHRAYRDAEALEDHNVMRSAARSAALVALDDWRLAAVSAYSARLAASGAKGRSQAAELDLELSRRADPCTCAAPQGKSRLSRSRRRIQRTDRNVSVASVVRLANLLRAWGETAVLHEWLQHTSAAGPIEPCFEELLLDVVRDGEGHYPARVCILARLAESHRDVGDLVAATARLEEAGRLFLLMVRRIRGANAQSVQDARKLLIELGYRIGIASHGTIEDSEVLAALAGALLLKPDREGNNTTLEGSWSALGTKDALVGLMALAVGLAGAESGTLVGIDDGHLTERVTWPEAAANSANVSWAVITKTIDTNTEATYDDVLSVDELWSHRSIAGIDIRSLVCLPVIFEGEMLGAMYLQDSRGVGRFSGDVVQRVRAVATLLAAELQRQRMTATLSSVQARLQRAEDRLLRSERTRTMSEVASGLAHDIKNMFTAVMARAQMVSKMTSDARSRRSMDAIENAAQIGSELLERLHQCARDRHDEMPTPVGLLAVAREAKELLAPRLRSDRVTCAVQGSADVIVRAVPGELREMFLNLIANALDAVAAGGRISVSIVLVARGRGRVTVEDDGCGMSPETQARLFEAFFSTKGASGTGLGLAIVQRIVASCGGRISVNSAEGRGTTFEIELPNEPAS